MTDLRIVDAPVLLQESITDDVKMPTGGLGNYAIRLGDLAWYVATKGQLATKTYVNSKDGDLSTLVTTDKTSLVKAINEVVSVKANKATTLAGYGIVDAYNQYYIDTKFNGTLTIKPSAFATPTNNGDMAFELTSNTTLKIKVKGSDGVVRSASLTLA